MSDSIAPLLFWMLANAGGKASPNRGVDPPRWPTPNSPPPIPAFSAQSPPMPPAPSADQGGTSTPLAALHATPPKVPSASRPAAAKKSASKSRVPSIVPGVLQSSLPVLKLQQALNRRGAQLKPDGLYGPKTAAAWASMAKSKLLPSAITRVGPKVARVATSTYDTLSLPPIP